MVTLANGFSETGCQVDLVLARAEGPYLSEVATGVNVVDLGVSRVIVSLGGLVRYLRRERPAAMLSAMSHANVVAIAARWLSGHSTRLLVSERTHFSVYARGDETVSGRSLVHLMRWMYPSADGIVAVSGGVAADLVKTVRVTPSLIHVIHNPVVSARLLERSQEAVYHPWFEPGEPPVILAVGRLTEAKDYPTLIRAFAQLRLRRVVRLMILGEGKLRGELEALVRELTVESDVLLPGFSANPYAFMRRAAVFVLSSTCEGLPNALMEAMACGVPVVSSDCPSGPAEILEGGKWGRLVPVGDADSLAQAIALTLNDKVHPNAVSRAADFSVDSAVASYLRALFPKAEGGGSIPSGVEAW